jgi:hypothetical protein
MSNLAINKGELDEMLDLWTRNNLEDEFFLVHHFWDSSYGNKKDKLNSYYKYCAAQQFLGENNRQTLKRALALGRWVEEGLPLHQAFAQAWMQYPVLPNPMSPR